MKFSIKDFFSICDEIRSFLRIWSYLMKKSLMEDFVFCSVICICQKYQKQRDIYLKTVMFRLLRIFDGLLIYNYNNLQMKKTINLLKAKLEKL